MPRTASTPVKHPSPYPDAFKHFLQNTEAHQLTVHSEDGLHRHLRVGAPGTGIWSWQVITWPGYLATVGDVADGYTFSRLDDMLDFFAVRQDYYDDGAPCVDFGYWAEKLRGLRGGRGVREYSSSVFLALVRDTLEEHETFGHEAQLEYENIVEATRQVYALNGREFDLHTLPKLGIPDLEIDETSDLQREHFGEPIPEESPAARREAILVDASRHSDDRESARRWLSHHEELVGSDASWEWDLDDYNVHFIYACYAINLTVQLWREHVARRAAAAAENRVLLSVQLGYDTDDDSTYVRVESVDVLNSSLDGSLRDAAEPYAGELDYDDLMTAALARAVAPAVAAGEPSDDCTTNEQKEGPA